MRGDLIEVCGEEGLRRLAAHLLGDREQPVVGVARAREGGQPVLSGAQIRAVVGPDATIYYIASMPLLRLLRDTLGPALALGEGTVRVWWPELSVRSDPADHPVVFALVDEPAEDTAAELGREFELSRPGVRRELKLIEDARALVEQQVASATERIRDAEQRLRDAQIARHAASTRAAAAEARLGEERRG